MCQLLNEQSFFFSVPTEPLGPGLSQIAGKPTSLSVNWKKPQILNGIITHYTVYCEDTRLVGDSLSLGMENGTEVGGNITSAIVVGLLPYTTYDCFVTASTSAGEGNYSIVVSATTDESGKYMYLFKNFKFLV